MAPIWVSRRVSVTFCGVCLLMMALLVLILGPNYTTKVWLLQATQGQKWQSSVGSNSIAIPLWNQPPKQHVPEATPLFIGFTRNWLILKQAVISYITAGWPASDIYVVDNSGTMMSNTFGQLSPENPFYLEHDYLNRILGVNVLTTPTLQSFAQLQNFYLYTSTLNHWSHYFWSHMDIVALTNETEPLGSFYSRAVDALRQTLTDPAWGIRFFSYDRLTLANVAAYTAVGGFDTFIPYYTTDCDFHFRISEANYTTKDATAGLVFDVGDTLPDLSLLFRENTVEARATCTSPDIEAAAKTVGPIEDSPQNSEPYGRGDCRFHALKRMAEALDLQKQTHEGGRNYWQSSKTGGLGDPFWQVPEGFESALWMHIDHGRKVYERKWSHGGCDLREAGRSCKDAATCSAWRVKEEKS